MVPGRVLHVVKPLGRPWNRPPPRVCPGGFAPPSAPRCGGGPISRSCSSSTSMGLSFEVTGASCDPLAALPRAGIGSTDHVPPGSSMTAGAPASVAPAATVRRDFWPLLSWRRALTVRYPAAFSFSAPPSPRVDCVLLVSVGDVQTISSFSKSSTRLAGHKSLISVFLQRIPSVAGQGSHVVCTHSNSSGGDAYK